MRIAMGAAKAPNRAKKTRGAVKARRFGLSASVKAFLALGAAFGFALALGASVVMPGLAAASDVFGGSGASASASDSEALPDIRFPLTEEDAEAMISEEAGKVPEADPSVLPPETQNPPEISMSDDEMKDMGVPDSVIEATKGSGMSEKDEWACTCLLCLANPNGWQSVSECRPPVKRLFDYLKKHSMPKCPNAGAGNDMVLVSNPTDPCRQMNLEDVTGWIYVPGRGPVHSSAYQNEGTDYCVKGYQKTRRMCVEHDSEGYCTLYANVRYFDEVERNTHESPYSIDVIIGGEVFNRTHGWR